MWSTFSFTVGPTRSLFSLFLSLISLSLFPLASHRAGAPLSPTAGASLARRIGGAGARRFAGARRRRGEIGARGAWRWRGRPCGARWWRGRSGEVRRRLRLEKRRGRRRQAPSGASSSRHHHGRWAGLPPRRPLLANSIVLPPHLAGVLGPSDGDDWWHGLGGGGGGRRGPVWRDDHLGAR